MTVDVDKLKSLKIDKRPFSYSARDARLYALSVGFATDPLCEAELDFVSQREPLLCVPSMATIFADTILELTLACQFERPELALHGQQKLELFQSLPGEAELEVSASISEIYDRGAEKGAEVHMTAEGRLRGSKSLLYRTSYVTIARGDGGFGGLAPLRQPQSNAVPGRDADGQFIIPTNANQALWYALNGDPNPIHTLPEIARKAGFERPIAHGLCTYGMACRALLARYCNYDPSRMKRFDARFSAPVYPGETLVVLFWELPSGVAFQVRATEREVWVLKGGYCELA